MIRLLLNFTIVFLVTVSVSLAADESFGGVGLQVVPTINGDLVVLNVLKDSPSAQKGLQPGDLVFQVDDFILEGSDFGKVISDHLWGAAGTPVVLHYRRPGVAGSSQVEIVRTSMDPRLTVTPSVQDLGNQDRSTQK